MNQGIQIWS